MSIELSNGVVLPDFPTAYTDDRFIGVAPDLATLKYHVVFYQASTNKYYLSCSDIPVICFETGAGPIMFILLDMNTGQQSMNYSIFGCDLDDTALTWKEEDSGPVSENSFNFIENSTPVVWADHDVVQYGDAAGESLGVYFPSSVSSVPEIMSVTGEWLVSMAGHTRRLSGTSDKFTPEQMDEFYGGLEIPEVGEVTLQEKSVEPSTEAQEIVADSGFDGLSKVSVGAVALREETATPASADFVVTPGDGYMGLSTVTVKAAPTQGIIIVPSTEQQLIKPSGDVVGYSQISVMPPSMEKLTVTPTTEEQVFTPTTGYVGFSTVAVKAAESGGGGSDIPSAEGVEF